MQLKRGLLGWGVIKMVDSTDTKLAWLWLQPLFYQKSLPLQTPNNNG